ncbi:uncharacterized protein QC761_0021370 [Podospora bellae-mahoneyi]|uniref:Uncharacterized protein n=1 Tax=Podospora bellae-mahoneyi TaxID=2093777 RepID=A0ABR0G189_9PEZI|nr:hypothetical protein QC761_0021370 [Podospora bellae-mahoneyi]
MRHKWTSEGPRRKRVIPAAPTWPPNLHLDLRGRSTQHSPASHGAKQDCSLFCFATIWWKIPPVSRRYPEPKLEAVSFALLTLCRSLSSVELLFASGWPRGELLVTTIPELESTKDPIPPPPRAPSAASHPPATSLSQQFQPAASVSPLQRRKINPQFVLDLLSDTYQVKAPAAQSSEHSVCSRISIEIESSQPHENPTSAQAASRKRLR